MVFRFTFPRKTIFHLIRRMVITWGEISSKHVRISLCSSRLAVKLKLCSWTSIEPPGPSCECAEMRQMNEDWQQDQAQEKVWASGFVLNVNACRTSRLNHVKWRTGENRKVSFIRIDCFQNNNSNKRFFLNKKMYHYIIIFENESSFNFLGIFLATKWTLISPKYVKIEVCSLPALGNKRARPAEIFRDLVTRTSV